MIRQRRGARGSVDGLDPKERGDVSVSDSAVVGVIANPASGRDIRRLVTGASVFDNAEKARMVVRLLGALGATGVNRVVMMPAGDSITGRLERELTAISAVASRAPTVELLDMPLRDSAQDSTVATAEMRRRGANAIVVLGGDGTHRAVAKASGGIPLCPLSTGTNNAFPGMHEATTAGLACGLVATGRLGPEVLRSEKVLRLGVNSDTFTDLAVVDVAVTTNRFVGARAIWQPEGIREFFVTFANPSAVGLVGVAGLLEPVARSDDYGLHVRLAHRGSVSSLLTAPLAPGLLVELGVAEVQRLSLDEAAVIKPVAGSIALDGEREIELRGDETVEVRLGRGPLTIDVDEAMRQAAQRRLLVEHASDRRSDQSRQLEAIA